MIAGIGVDIVHDEQLPEGVLQPDDPFFKHSFTKREWGLACEREDAIRFLRGRFAAKEAVFKALGAPSDELKRWDDIEVISSAIGAPLVILHGAAKRWADARGVGRWLVSLSSDRDCHVSFCVAVSDRGLEGK